MFRYLIFYKPYGVLCQFTDSGGVDDRRLTLKDYIDVSDVYPVGRLDRDSEGLVLLTDDGRFQHLVSDPRYGHSKFYWCQVEGIPTEEAIAKLQEGVVIQKYRTLPCKVRLLEDDPMLPVRVPGIRYRKSIPTCWLEVILTEGKNRQVRRMTASVGFPTLRLVRFGIKVGNKSFSLDDLKLGEWRFVRC